MKKSKSKKAKVQHYGYAVEVHQTCTHSEYSSEPYGDWSESYDNRLDSVARKGAEYPDVTSIHDIAEGEDAWVVWVEWSAGDSFGWATRSATDVIGIFRKQDYHAAEELAEQIQNKKKDSNFSYEFHTSDGQTFTGCASWIGYFDSLENVNIDRVCVVRSK